MTLPAINPYLNRTAIRDDRDFFGRRREMATIFSRIEAREPQSVSIVGERRLGKSSLLRALMRRRTAFLDRPDKFVFLYLDLQGNMHGDVTNFFSALTEEIALARKDAVIAESRPTYENVRNLVARLSRAGVTLVLLLDEFEAITLNRNFTIEFFSFLRSLPNNYSVSFIVSSAHELQEICHSKEIAGSPFFNIFHKLNLGCLAPEEADELIVRPSRGAGYPLETHASFIHRLAGYFPFFLQLACCACFEFHHEYPDADNPDEADIRQRFHEEAQNHFEYLWDHFSERERALCLKVSRREALNDSDRSFLRNLTRRGYFSEGTEGVRLFSDAFDAFLKMKTPAAASHNIWTEQTAVTQSLAGADLTGTSVGRFVLRRRLGAGGMGEVYLAEDTKLKRRVALKRMAARLKEHLPYRRRFLNEAKRASQLSDPHIVAVYDFLEEHGEIFLVMEYVEGRTLRQTLDGPLKLEQFLDIARQCAEAMVAAHDKSIIHCDIKPENIVITPNGLVKVLDFGLAKCVQSFDTADTTVMDHAGVTVFGGTPGYMAPEVLMEQGVDARSDIFSLGVVFYEAISGYHPFRSSTQRGTADRILREAPTPLIRFNAQVPAGLERIVYRCLEKNPNDRYQCSRDLVADLILLCDYGESRAAFP